MSKRLVLTRFAALAASAGLALAGASAAAAYTGGHGGTTPTSPAPATPPAADTTFFAAELKGANEVPAANGGAVNDKDGSARAVVRIQGNQVCFTLDYAKIGAPTAGHIHAGAAGTNGDVKVAFFTTPLADGLRVVTGCVTAEPPVIDAIKANPAAHYVNLHTADFGAGAVRGQLRKLDRAVDLLSPFRGPLVGLMDGGQETPALGDQDGRATGFARTQGRKLDFAFTWSGIDGPNLGHIHNGRIGAAGPVAVPLFSVEGGLPASIQGVAGTVEVDKKLGKRIARYPHEFYFNLHNKNFGQGVVRGQLFRP